MTKVTVILVTFHVDNCTAVYEYACVCLCRFALGWVLVLTAMLILGTEESARCNLVGIDTNISVYLIIVY
jgi:hypothetical protein